MAGTPGANGLLSEIEETRDDGKRRELLRKACDLFEISETKLNDHEARLFDDVLGMLSCKVTAQLKAELAERVSDKGSALKNTIRSLAFDDEIVVARPVLRHSSILTDETLVEIAQKKGQAHMAIIAERPELSARVTDALVELGDQTVLHKVAGNSGAKLSDPSIGSLTEKSRDDETLQKFLADREDLSPAVLRQLINLATDNIRQKVSDKLMNAGQIVDAARSALEKDLGIDQIDFLAADRRVRVLARKTPLEEAALKSFAENGLYAELVVALSMLMDVSLEQAKHLMIETNALLIAARAIGFAEDTVNAMLRVGPAFEKLGEDELQALLEEFKAITPGTAQRVMRFWQTRKKLAAA